MLFLHKTKFKDSIKECIKNKESILKFIIIIFLLIISILLTLYFLIILKITILYSHFYYLPIILSCLWWKYKGLIIPFFFSSILILEPYFFGIVESQIDNYIRAMILIVIGFVVASLSTHVSYADYLSIKSEKKYLQAYENAEFYKDLFIHDISNILQNILSSVELLSLWINKTELEEDINEIFLIINDQLSRGAKLVSNIRRISEISDSSVNLHSIDLFPILKRLIKFIHRTYPNKNIDININEDIKNAIIKADLFIENVFENIIFNAIKYNENVKIKILIKVSRLIIENVKYIKIQFIDNGIGISDNMKQKIFEGITKRKEKIKGMGLGLLLVKCVINNYNGRIWVEDNIEGDFSKGSNFILLLPEMS